MWQGKNYNAISKFYIHKNFIPHGQDKGGTRETQRDMMAHSGTSQDMLYLLVLKCGKVRTIMLYQNCINTRTLVMIKEPNAAYILCSSSP
jgi:hypothetical protein